MWCSQCQSDVATEISSDGQRLLCTICGEEVRKVFAPSQHPETRSARELLERWSKSDLLSSHKDDEPVEVAAAVPAHEAEQLEVTAPEPVITPAASSTPIPPPRHVVRPAAELPEAASEPETTSDDTAGGADLLPSANDRASRRLHRGPRPASPTPRETPYRPERPAAAPRQYRVDASHDEQPRQHVDLRPVRRPVEPSRIPAEVSSSTSPKPAEKAPVARSDEREYFDDRPHTAPPPPHFDMEVFAANSGRKPGRHESIFGQLLAYLGVGLLTVGTALVVWGYFGGPAVQKYQSTGWLISTAGQMLLFLGVVTLVSGGMQQTTHEVAQRVELLGGRMHRIEQSTQELLKGPYFNKSQTSTRSKTSD